jgi:hypothetical protein
MTTADSESLAERVAQQLAAVVIAALRPDTTSPDAGPDPESIGEAAGRLGDEFISLLHQLEPRLADPDDTLPGVARGDSAVARAARLSSHIMLSGMPGGSDPD